MVKSDKSYKKIPIFDGQIPMMSALSVSQISQLQEELGQYWADHCDYARCGSEVANPNPPGPWGTREGLYIYIVTQKINQQEKIYYSDDSDVQLDFFWIQIVFASTFQLVALWQQRSTVFSMLSQVHSCRSWSDRGDPKSGRGLLMWRLGVKMDVESYGYGSVSKPINTIFRGMNIHLPGIFYVHQGYKVLTHCHMCHLCCKPSLRSLSLIYSMG